MRADESNNPPSSHNPSATLDSIWGVLKDFRDNQRDAGLQVCPRAAIAIMQRIRDAIPSATWLPMECAPTNRRILLELPNGIVTGGMRNDDRHSSRPTPYWEHDWVRILGISDARANPPTGWMELPSARQAGVGS